MTACACGHVFRRDDTHDCPWSRPVKWGTVACPMCNGETCEHCEGGQVTTDKFERLVATHCVDDEYPYCPWCSRVATAYDEHGTRCCAKCLEEMR
jgi:hypothetical protein